MADDNPFNETVMRDINDAVAREAARVRVAQKIFPGTVLAGSTEVIDEIIKFPQSGGMQPALSMENRAKRFVEIYQFLSLTATQAQEPTRRTAMTLARMAAKAVALAEDKLLFQGKDAALGTVVADGVEALGTGLLGVASPSDASDADASKVSVPINVVQRSTRPPIWGEHLFSAVGKGISNLTANKGQTPRYALILPVDAHADSFVPLSGDSLTTPAAGIRSMVEGGFAGTAGLPTMVPPMGMMTERPGKGLLVALGGDPTTIYVGRDAVFEFIRKEGQTFLFRVVERVQFVASDPRAFVVLNFLQTPSVEGPDDADIPRDLDYGPP